MRILIGIIFSFLCIGCFSTSNAGPDSGTMPDDGTVIVGDRDQEKEENDLIDMPDEELPDETTISDELLVDNDTPPPAVEVFFDDAVRATILAELGRAQSSVRFVTYTFRDEAVMTALNTLAAQGVDVAGIAGSPIEAGTPHYPLVAYEDTGEGIVHEKFFVIDGSTALITSANIAYQDIRNFLVVIRDDIPLANELIWEYQELAAFRRGAAKVRHCDPYCPLKHGKLVITPASCNDIAALLNGLSDDAEGWLAMYTLTDDAPMFDELIGAVDRGFSLHATLDDWSTASTPANQYAFDQLDGAGAAVAYYDGSMVFHHKFFVTDDILEFGSMNWTYSGCAKNDELYFITDEPPLIEPFLDYASSL
ncbi:MAG TPA: phospholipase D-like domain-containing protein [bacterium]|nr:phospholipase D-like domain-containing protein [bacterium]